jgi:uncharacterized protein
MNVRPEFTRRQFLERALATAATYGLARLGGAAEGESTSAAMVNEIVDTHVYLGRWPHQRLAGDELGELVALLRRNHVSCAWVGSFDGLFHKDIAGVNERLSKTCTEFQEVGPPTTRRELTSKSGETEAAAESHPLMPRLIPLGSINPTLPDWEEDVLRCHKTFKMPGIRLHPNYHGYTLDDPRFARVLEIASARGLVVQLVSWMEDARHLFLNPHGDQVDLKPLAAVIARFSQCRLVMTNAFRSTDDADIRPLLAMEQLYFVARANNLADVRQLVDKTSPNRVVFGSGAPLRSFDSATLQMGEAVSEDGALRAVAYINASRLLPLPEKIPQ